MEDRVVDLLYGYLLALLLRPEYIADPIIDFVVARLVGNAHSFEGLPKSSLS